MTSKEALVQLRLEPFEDLGYAEIDHHRSIRQGAFEVIYDAGKTPEQIDGIVDAMRKAGQNTILITRMKKEAAEFISVWHSLNYHDMRSLGVRISTMRRMCLPRQTEAFNTPHGPVRIQTAGGASNPEYEDIVRIARENDIALRYAAKMIKLS